MVGSLRVDDPEPRYAEVRLCSDLPLMDRDFVRDDGGWVLQLPQLHLARLEYQLEIRDLDGSRRVICDPGNPRLAPGPFGEKSVVLAPSYRPPSWLDERPPAGARSELDVRVLGQRLTIPIWAPADGQLPLLVAHDGPEYDALASLTRYAGAMIERGTVAPFRVALLPPGDRNEWYSASATYGRALCTRIVPAMRAEIPVVGRPVGIGASLGALSLLHAQRGWPGTFAGLFLQSGSFFVPRYDRHEAGFQRYARVTRFVGGVLRTQRWAEPVPTVMTCGAEEENVHNNRLMASALAAQGYPVTFQEVADLHNFTSWRDAFEPWLTGLLARLWPRR
jgi:enterochelin esterase family protein